MKTKYFAPTFQLLECTDQEQNSVVLNACIHIQIEVIALVLILQTWEVSLTYSYIETFKV
jgi:hypothetical protein